MERQSRVKVVVGTMKRFIQGCMLTVGVTLSQAAAAQTGVDLVARGRYLVDTIAACGHCHTPQGLENNRQLDLPGLHLAGGYGFEGPVLGRWAGSNITSDPETGIGRWTEAEIAIAVREGRRPDDSLMTGRAPGSGAGP